MNFYNFLYKRNDSGFTLIELVVTMIMIGIMAATIVPKFLTSKGFEEYTYRDELITKLRAIQLRTLQQTNGDRCYTVGVNSSSIGLFATTENANTCKSIFLGETTSVHINVKHAVNFSISDNIVSFSFSPMGRPLGCNSVSPCEIEIIVSGENALIVKINSEGYIYAL